MNKLKIFTFILNRTSRLTFQIHLKMNIWHCILFCLYLSLHQSVSELTIDVDNNSEENFIFQDESITSDSIKTAATINITTVTHISLTQASCQQFALPKGSLAALQSTCANTVNYPFFVPANVSLEFLELKARESLNSTKLNILPNLCQISLKKLVCSNIYLQCYPNINLNNKKTWNFKIYAPTVLFPVPFVRPCQAVCQNVVDTCDNILNLLPSGTPSCVDTLDYSGGRITTFTPTQYDPANNTASCNMQTAVFNIGAANEPYLGGVCSGLLTNIFIPPSSSVNPLLAPLLPMNVLQTVIETTLAKRFANIPSYNTISCFDNLRSFLCHSVYLGVTGIPLKTAFLQKFGNAGVVAVTVKLNNLGIVPTQFLSTIIDVPMFPDVVICENYLNICQNFIRIAKNSALSVKCNETTVINGIVVRKFPAMSQVVANFDITVGATNLIVPFNSPPYNITDNVSNGSTFASLCPTGFVIPEVPNDSRNVYIDGTACAVGCRYV